MNCLLLEPILGQLIGVMLNIDYMPGWMTWVGVVIISISINVIHQGSERLKA